MKLGCLSIAVLAMGLGMVLTGCATVDEYLTEGVHQVIAIRAPEATVTQVAEKLFVANGYRFSPIKREMLMQTYYQPLTACSSAFYVSQPNQDRRWCEIALQPQDKKTLVKVVCFRPHSWPFQDFEGEDFEPSPVWIRSVLSEVKKKAEEIAASP